MTRHRRRLNQDGAPAVNNTTEVLLMGAIAIIQVVLFALAAAKVQSLAMFDNTEFLPSHVVSSKRRTEQGRLGGAKSTPAGPHAPPWRFRNVVIRSS